MKKGINKLIGAIIAGVALSASTSCTDDHFDVDGGGYSVTDATVWEQIKSRPNLSKFASIVEKAKYYKDEKHAVSTTFADILSANSCVTVWAPENSAFTDEQYENYLKMAETDGYNLQQQFLGNHISLWRYNISGTGTSNQFRLINDKISSIDYDKKTFMTAHMDEVNIGAKNGMLHTLKDINTFNYNFYELIKFNDDSQYSFNNFSKFLVQRDTTYFSESLSIEGLPDENGNPTYVDSVYFTTNRMFMSKSWDDGGDREWLTKQYGFGAPINVEDSTYIMIIPTDQAWDNMLSTLEPYYTYTTVYPDQQKLTNKETGYQVTTSNPDSVSLLNRQMDMVRPLVFNLNEQPQLNHQKWTLETFLESADQCEYFLNTYGDTIRNVYDAAGNIIWNKTELFKGTQKTMSNGVAFITDTYPYPSYYYKKNVDIEPNLAVYFSATNTTLTTPTISNSVAGIDVTGRCKNESYLHFEGSSKTAQPSAVFRAQGTEINSDVMSGDYEIQIVMVPGFYNSVTDSIIDADGNIRSDLSIETNKLQVNVYYMDGVTQPTNYWYANTKEEPLMPKFTSDDIYYDGTKVDTITVTFNGESRIHFPVSYENVKYSYPLIEVKSSATSADAKKDKSLVRNKLNVDRVILINKDGDLNKDDDQAL